MKQLMWKKVLAGVFGERDEKWLGKPRKRTNYNRHTDRSKYVPRPPEENKAAKRRKNKQ